jgi:hypothetical protein
MEMIEDKISRLTPDQQREVEDFIDFLITRDSNVTHSIQNHEKGDNYSGIRNDVTQPAPMIFAEERPVAGRNDQDILPDYPEYGGYGAIGETRKPERNIIIPRRVEKEPGRLLDWID